MQIHQTAIEGSPGGSDSKEYTCMQDMWVGSLGWEDAQEEGMATHSSIVAWRIPMDRGSWQATIHWISENWIQLSTAQTMSNCL